jgi:predicted RNA binding protein YcfA (HicA-like mRNA interferase family)
MGKQEKLLNQLANHSQDANWNFHNMTGLLQRLGWEMRVRGSHHFFHKTEVRDIINLQPAGSKAKGYQVRQVRNVLQSLGVL